MRRSTQASAHTNPTQCPRRQPWPTLRPPPDRPRSARLPPGPPPRSRPRKTTRAAAASTAKKTVTAAAKTAARGQEAAAPRPRRPPRPRRRRAKKAPAKKAAARARRPRSPRRRPPRRRPGQEGDRLARRHHVDRGQEDHGREGDRRQEGRPAKKATAAKTTAAKATATQGDRDQGHRRQEGSGQEGSGQEGHDRGEEDDRRQEDDGQEDHGRAGHHPHRRHRDRSPRRRPPVARPPAAPPASRRRTAPSRRSAPPPSKPEAHLAPPRLHSRGGAGVSVDRRWYEGDVVTRLVKAPRIDFAGLRRELELPDTVPARGAARGRRGRRRRRRPATAVRPPAAAATAPTSRSSPSTRPTSRDLDQAMCLRRVDGGYRVFYAIADVTAFVPRRRRARGGDVAPRRDGLPARRQGAAASGVAVARARRACCPGRPDRPRCGRSTSTTAGATTAVRVERAIVRSRAKLDYVGVQADADAGTLERLDRAAARDRPAAASRAGSTAAPSTCRSRSRRSSRTAPAGDWCCARRIRSRSGTRRSPLLTGMAAAAIMLKGGLGLLRTMPAPRPEAVALLRTAAAGLGIDWPDGASVGTVLAARRPGQPARGRASSTRPRS